MPTPNTVVSLVPAGATSVQVTLLGGMVFTSTTKGDGTVVVSPGPSEASIPLTQPPKDAKVSASLLSVVVDVQPVGDVTINAIIGVYVDQSTHTGGAGITFSSSTPTASDGSVGDTWVYLTTLAIYEKTNSTTWTIRGYLASNVTNTEAKFACPDGTERGTILTP